VHPHLIAVPARILNAPQVKYRKGMVNARDGAWNMSGIQFCTGANIPKWYSVTIDIIGQRNIHPDDLQTSIDIFGRALTTNGLNVPVKGAVLPGPPRGQIKVNPGQGDYAQLIMVFDAALKNNVTLLWFVLGAKDTQTYNRIKFLGDVKYGIHTVCSLGAKLTGHRANEPQYFANVALKFNLKLGGVNQLLDPQKLGIISEGKTMVVGLDVTHPSPGSAENAPSVAGIVASIDKSLAQWPAAISVQTGRQEMVSGLKDLLKSRLRLWKEKGRNTQLPENILIYRDGVSEGQYDIVLDNELPLLRQACAETYPADMTKKQLPKITVVVVGKRHHTRFYPATSDDSDRNDNPRPGTVVDRAVTEARHWDFFLQAHAALKGTARPAHYFVILDEIFTKGGVKPDIKQNHRTHADTLENLTHNMCYLFGRATKAVSVCPPAYYADLVCERARCYLAGVFDPSEASPAPSVAASRSSVNAEDATIHNSIKDTMFYI